MKWYAGYYQETGKKVAIVGWKESFHVKNES